MNKLAPYKFRVTKKNIVLFLFILNSSLYSQTPVKLKVEPLSGVTWRESYKFKFGDQWHAVSSFKPSIYYGLALGCAMGRISVNFEKRGQNISIIKETDFLITQSMTMLSR